MPAPAQGRVPEWTASDLNREPFPCEGIALPVGASSPWSGAWGIRTPDLLHAMQMLYQAELRPHGRRDGCRGGTSAGMAACRDAHAMDVSWIMHVHPGGWCSAGTERFELPTRSFGGCCSATELRPYVNENRPFRASPGAVASCSFRGLRGDHSGPGLAVFAQGDGSVRPRARIPVSRCLSLPERHVPIVRPAAGAPQRVFAEPGRASEPARPGSVKAGPVSGGVTGRQGAAFQPWPLASTAARRRGLDIPSLSVPPGGNPHRVQAVFNSA
jgi:hypothetical protein